jgi:hypothetical protein
MYKGTRHTRATWSYKSSKDLSRFELKMLVDRCKETFVPLQLLRPEDFERPIGNGRITRSREMLVSLGIPQTVIAGVPLYVLAAPLFGGLMSRISRRPVTELPAELYSLHAHLRTKTFEAPKRGPSPEAKTLYHVAKDGTRTAFERKTPVSDALSTDRRRPKPMSRPANSEKTDPALTVAVAGAKTGRVLVAPDTALSLALRKAMGPKDDKTTG